MSQTVDPAAAAHLVGMHASIITAPSRTSVMDAFSSYARLFPTRRSSGKAITSSFPRKADQRIRERRQRRSLSRTPFSGSASPCRETSALRRRICTERSTARTYQCCSRYARTLQRRGAITECCWDRRCCWTTGPALPRSTRYSRSSVGSWIVSSHPIWSTTSQTQDGTSARTMISAMRCSWVRSMPINIPYNFIAMRGSWKPGYMRPLLGVHHPMWPCLLLTQYTSHHFMCAQIRTPGLCDKTYVTLRDLPWDV